MRVKDPYGEEKVTTNFPNTNVAENIEILKKESAEEDYLAENPELTLAFASPIAIHKMFEWQLEEAVLKHFRLQLPEKQIEVRNITKLKCLS